jgi:bacillithiol system protein YtxJ
MIALTPETLDAVLAEPRVLLFKHSPRCGVSRWAHEAMEEVEQLHPAVPVVIVDVVHARPLSQEVAARTGVAHQSPQLLLLERGRAAWHLSHGAISSEAVRRRLEGAPDRVRS